MPTETDSQNTGPSMNYDLLMMNCRQPLDRPQHRFQQVFDRMSFPRLVLILEIDSDFRLNQSVVHSVNTRRYGLVASILPARAQP